MSEQLATPNQKYVPPTTREDRTSSNENNEERIDHDNTLASNFEDLRLKRNSTKRNLCIRL